MHSRFSCLEDSIREAVYVRLSSRFALVRSGNHSKPHKIGWLQQRRFISSTEAGKSKIRTLEDYATVASLFLTLRWPLSRILTESVATHLKEQECTQVSL